MVFWKRRLLQRRRFGRGVDPLGLSPSHTSLLQMANRVMMISGWCEEFDISSKPDTDQLANSQNWSFVFELTRLFCFCPAFNQVHLTHPLLEHTILVLCQICRRCFARIESFHLWDISKCWVGGSDVVQNRLARQRNCFVDSLDFLSWRGGAALQEIDWERKPNVWRFLSMSNFWLMLK